MLIYNHKKEFIAIDEADLKALSLSSIVELQEEAADFADLFVKSPGFIHNFKHVHWIDYILCNESTTDSKAIIKVKGKNHSTNIQIKIIYLLENPTQKAFIVEFINLKSLSQAQEEKLVISSSTQQEPQELTHTPKVKKEETIYENLSPNIIKDPYEQSVNEVDYAPLVKSHDLEIQEQDLISESTISVKAEPIVKEKVKVPLAELSHDFIEDEDSAFSGYSYDPHVASDELGLPIDLVEEFIQDFIAQANSFKEDLYNSLTEGNMDHLKIQSHKLKGVAANLRIEDALDALTIVNSSHDEYDIQKNLDRFYSIINKLSKKDTQENIPLHTPKKEEIEDDFIISIKNELPSRNHDEVLDLDVHDFIEASEMADDTFLELSTDLKNDELLIEDELSSDDKAQNNSLSTTSHYDKTKVAHDIGLSIDSFNELFDDYLIETKAITKALSKSLKSKNLDECKNSAKKLKGMSENMRVHDFDIYLDSIISSTNINEVEENIKNIILALNLISETEVK
ncbi:MAG TPA: Hpt domain-containing protein [Sulfurimonas sp.]|uniref:Hpt domain-containing protein n=1 Tax=Sulfurimonas sp. TaxID=2022749 RepID=UPI002B9A63B9|nr:Hpt domain-containing protein [Sulfurimonas sp.]HUH42790.1 Hpt domain-containing protein [Sulfurimonas sp.]